MPNTLNATESDLTFDVSIEAKYAGGREVKGTAYDGHVLRLNPPTIMDLSGLEVGDSVVLLTDHRDQLDHVVGTASVTISDEGRRLDFAGQLDASPRADRLVDLLQQGVTLEASIGARAMDGRMLAAGESVQVNGQVITVDQPTRLVTSWRLREVSIVLNGAAARTAVVLASHGKEGIMPETKTQSTDDILRAERARIRQLNELFTDDIRASLSNVYDLAVDGQISIEEAERHIATFQSATTRQQTADIHASHAANRPTAQIGRANPAEDVALPSLIAASLAKSWGYGDVIEAAWGERTAAAADRMSHISVMDAARLLAESEGKYRSTMSKGELIQASGTTTYSLPNLLGDVVRKVAGQKFQEAPSYWRSFASIKSVADFRTHKSIALMTSGELAEIAKDGEIKHGALAEGEYDFSASTFGKMFSITRKDLVNDQLGELAALPGQMAQLAARSLNNAVAKQLLTGAGYFSVPNNNYLSGGSSPLAFDSLASAVDLILMSRDEAGNLIDAAPRYLIVGPALRQTAIELTQSDSLQWLYPDSQTLGARGTANAHRGIEVIVDPRLNDTSLGGSDTVWYLSAGSRFESLVVGFLNGVQSPTVEVDDQAFNKLGMQMRCYWDYGTAFGRKVGLVKSAGA